MQLPLYYIHFEILVNFFGIPSTAESCDETNFLSARSANFAILRWTQHVYLERFCQNLKRKSAALFHTA